VTLWKGSRKNGLALLDFSSELASPGAMYGFVTKILGFTPNRHEGKVTGLAARGRMSDAYQILKEGFFYDKQAKKIKSRIGGNYTPFTMTEFEPLKEKLKSFSREDISWAAQELLEETLVGFLEPHLATCSGKSVNLCLAGGCMSNVKLNYRLAQLSQIRNIYVFPAMGDGGNALGGALNVAVTKGSMEHAVMPTVYLGPEYTNDEIEKALKDDDMPFEKIPSGEKARLVARLVADNVIVGWFQGRMEYGPRALGSRSILASPTDASINDSLNKRLQRSEFMPFAPVTIDKLAPICFDDWSEDKIASRFMTICYTCKPIMQERCPAVVHVDNTARPQVVFRGENPEYYDVVDEYYRLTGNPALINTSFNHHEEPILNSPEDAIRSFKKENIDVLVIGDFMVGNKSSENRLSRAQ
jgi:carbamoyltransferase